MFEYRMGGQIVHIDTLEMNERKQSNIIDMHHAHMINETATSATPISTLQWRLFCQLRW